ncbi:MAG: DUF1345 domain-containing protein [Phreatobacter sp.]|nr:DUF1345 domain-containing protein [Phreatobacter sp.]
MEAILAEPFLSRIGRRIAPPRFLLFAAIFVLVAACGSLWFIDKRIALLVGFDAAAVAFFLSALPLLNDSPGQMRTTAQANDANRGALLAITALLSVVILFAVGTLIANKPALDWHGVGLIVATLALSWCFANTIFALHYAHLFYLEGSSGDRGGLQVPGTQHPNYWDFLYFSFTLGMTFQTSDIAISGTHLRRVVLGHSMIAFLFNMGILAFTVNALGGL